MVAPVPRLVTLWAEVPQVQAPPLQEPAQQVLGKQLEQILQV
jgi:hypothetical protein